ncbi:MAG: DUF2007 domain-containing protein [Alphaproteobacteria bacterium]|nr:DUF2007 domain-containing protein [Alphaproteobacteria bacterium]
MKEIFRSWNQAEIAIVTSLLSGADIPFFVFDENTSRNMGLTFGFAPCRFMVLEDNAEEAYRLLKEAGLGEASDP